MLTSISSALEKLLVNTLGVNPDGAFLTKTLILAVSAAVILYLVWKLSKWVLLRWIPKATKRTKTEWD
ncbi:MAG: hypothetical protein QMB20_08985, partial [Flavobacteriales bacterium]